MTAADVLARLAEAVGVGLEVTAGAGWTGRGEGTVQIERQRASDDASQRGALLVTETGTWAIDGGRPIRWTAQSQWWADGDALAVEHHRQGVPASATLDRTGRQWQARMPHRCPPDAYDVALAVTPSEVVVTWTVTGPRKRDRVVTRYRPRGLPTNAAG